MSQALPQKGSLLCRLQSRFDELSQRLAQGFEGISADEGMAEIDAAVAAGRAAKT